MISPEAWLKTYNHLGSFYPFYCYNQINKLYTHIGDAIKNLPIEQRTIDPVAIVEFVTKSYILADRTMVQNISRVPWMARPDKDNKWEYASIPEHGFRRMPADEIAQELKLLLLDEISSYIQGKNQIGILLSGGMDSRILAGVIKELQLRNDWDGQVVAFTWGVEGSRDVKYAQQIASAYSWEWIHLNLNAETLYNNFFIAADIGAEFAPFHLHAMPEVANYRNLDAVLAASYGDSVGRAEFSGVHVLKLKPILSDIPRLRKMGGCDFGIIRSNIIKRVKSAMQNDAYGYRQYLGLDDKNHNYCEIEQEMHYMRRKLQAPMSYIGARIPLYQSFTAPKTFGFMWSLDPKIRNDNVYAELIKILPGNLMTIPWARTGRPFGKKNDGSDDDATRQHHMYGIWLREDLRDFVLSHVMSEPVLKLGIFNERTLDRLIKKWPHSKTITTNTLDEWFSWLTALAIFVERYDIKGIDGPNPAHFLNDLIRSNIGRLFAWIYLEAREKVRN